MENRITVTEENIEQVKSNMAANDQRDELSEGCVTWRIPGGQMTVWPTGRAAMSNGGNSVYGEWDLDQQLIVLDDTDENDDVITVDEYGTETVRQDA